MAAKKINYYGQSKVIKKICESINALIDSGSGSGAVTGVRGNAEATYRTGDVTLSYSNMGINGTTTGGTGNADGYIRTGQVSGVTIGRQATAEGEHAQATGTYSHVEGYWNIAGGNYGSHAEGMNNTITSGGGSGHAEGIQNTVSGSGAHCEGSNCTASGMSSHCEGLNCTASGGYGSHAEGYYSTASTYTTHAEGDHAVASGDTSHAEGYYVEAAGRYQHVSGKYNVVDSNSVYCEIIGNGTSAGARSNARTLDWSGNEVLAGNLTIGGGLTVSGSFPVGGATVTDTLGLLGTAGATVTLQDLLDEIAGRA